MRIIVPTPSTSTRNDFSGQASNSGMSFRGRESSSNKDLQCKVKYIRGDGNDDEIRRFKLEKQGASSFMNLKMKIAQVFPELGYGNFSVYWIDEHKELISFGTDMELAAAIDSARNGLLNIIVKVDSSMGGNMFGMAGFPGMQVPPGFNPAAAHSAFRGQPNMFYGMGAGMMSPGMNAGGFNFAPPPPPPVPPAAARPTNFAWSSSDSNGTTQVQMQAQTSHPREKPAAAPSAPSPPPPQATKPKDATPKQPPSQRSFNRVPQEKTEQEEPKVDAGDALRSSISRNQEKLQMLIQKKGQRKDVI